MSPEAQRQVNAFVAAVRADVDRRIAAAVDAAVRPLVMRLAQLETQALPLRYEGVHELGKTYSKGAFTTHAGSLWACVVNRTTARPGSGSADWQLAVKRGRDR